MESWEERLQKNLLQKAVNTQFGYNVPLEEFLEKAAPIGTRKTWQGGREFVKTAEGWKPVGKGKKSEKESTKTQPKPEKKSNESKITFDGDNMSINGVPVIVDKDYGYVKLGGRGVGMMTGALYPAGTGSDQLQGIVYTHAVSIMRRMLKEGKTLPEIDKHMSTAWRSPVRSDPQDNGFNGGRVVWNTVKEYLGLKIGRITKT